MLRVIELPVRTPEPRQKQVWLPVRAQELAQPMARRWCQRMVLVPQVLALAKALLVTPAMGSAPLFPPQLSVPPPA